MTIWNFSDCLIWNLKRDCLSVLVLYMYVWTVFIFIRKFEGCLPFYCLQTVWTHAHNHTHTLSLIHIHTHTHTHTHTQTHTIKSTHTYANIHKQNWAWFWNIKSKQNFKFNQKWSNSKSGGQNLQSWGGEGGKGAMVLLNRKNVRSWEPNVIHLYFDWDPTYGRASTSKQWI